MIDKARERDESYDSSSFGNEEKKTDEAPLRKTLTDTSGIENTQETLKAYRNDRILTYAKALEDFKFIDEKDSKVNGVQRILTKIEGTHNGNQKAYVFGFFEGNENIYCIVCSSSLDNKRKYAATYGNILGSFSEIR